MLTAIHDKVERGEGSRQKGWRSRLVGFGLLVVEGKGNELFAGEGSRRAQLAGLEKSKNSFDRLPTLIPKK